MGDRLPLLIFAGFLGLLCLGFGCEGDGSLTLLVELKTDLVPGVEFAAVHTSVATAAEPTVTIAEREVDVALGRDLTAGRRVAELDGLAPGTYVVTVSLVDIAGARVMSRDVVVTATATTGFTVLMTRNCVEVQCPAASGDPTHSACVGGRCVEPRCTPETPEYCPIPECMAASQCSGDVSACAEPTCENGTCLVRTETAMCGGGEYCDPAVGCTPVPALGDGGAMDAGPGDAGDAGDAGGGDADAGPGLPAWAQRAYVKASNTDVGDRFGSAVSVSSDGNTLAVAALDEGGGATGVGGDDGDGSAPFSGAVYVFARTGGVWAQQAYVKASNTETFDKFGYSLSLSADGNTLAVGSWYEDSAATGIDGNQANNSAFLAGAAYVFARTGGVWAPQAYVKASNTERNDAFGWSVSLSGDGDTLAVGSINEASVATGIGGDESDNTANAAGAVYVFSRSGDVWMQQAYVKASSTDENDRFGVSVSLSADGNLMAVGADGESSAATGIGGDESDNTASGAGAVYVFSRSGAAWAQEAYVKASNTGAGDAFGYSISLSGDGSTLAVGAFGEDSAATGIGGDQGDDTALGSGAVYLFARSGGVWAQEAYAKSSNTGGSDSFGDSVSLSADGTTVLVGAWMEDGAATGVDGDGSDDSALAAGAAYVFARRGGTWTHEAYVKASNTSTEDYFGGSVSLSGDGDTLVVGAWSEDSAATGVGGDQTNEAATTAGAMYIFGRSGTM